MNFTLTFLSFIALLSVALSATLPTTGNQTTDVTLHLYCFSNVDCPSSATCIDRNAILQGSTTNVCEPSSIVCMCHGPVNSCINSFGCSTGTRCVELYSPDFPLGKSFCLPCNAECDSIGSIASNRQSAVEKMKTSERQLVAQCLDNNPPSCTNPDPTRPAPPVGRTPNPSIVPAIGSPTTDTAPSLIFIEPPVQTILGASTSALPSDTQEIDYSMMPSPYASATSSADDGEDNDDDENVEIDEGSAVCIDAKALSAFAMSELIYEDGHKRAAVLCDSQENCATPGHVVVHHGRAVMMRTYCESVGCRKRVIEVNSPKMKYGLRVKSKSEHLQYTTLAARFETRMEERVLAVVARVYA